MCVWIIVLMVGLGRIWHWVYHNHQETNRCRLTLKRIEKHLAPPDSNDDRSLEPPSH